MTSKTIFGSSKDILMKFEPVLNLAVVTVYIKFYKGITSSFIFM